MKESRPNFHSLRQSQKIRISQRKTLSFGPILMLGSLFEQLDCCIIQHNYSNSIVNPFTEKIRTLLEVVLVIVKPNRVFNLTNQFFFVIVKVVIISTCENSLISILN